MASILATAAADRCRPSLPAAGTSLDGHVLLIGALVGLLVSVIPYSCELVALRSLRPAVFGILMSLEPAAAALAAIVVLQEHLSPLQWLAIGCVVAASIGATRSRPGAPNRPGASPAAGRRRRRARRVITRGAQSATWSPRAAGHRDGAAAARDRARPGGPRPRAGGVRRRGADPARRQPTTCRASRPRRAARPTGGTPTGPRTGRRRPRAARPRWSTRSSTGLEVPWGVDFLPDGDAVVTERIAGRVDRDRAGRRGDAARRGDEAVPQGEAGLLGVAVSPDFETDRTLYLYLTTEHGQPGRRASSSTTVGSAARRSSSTASRRASSTTAGRMAFGPDGHLYVSTGETGDPALAQDPRAWPGRSCASPPTASPRPATRTPTRPCGRWATATCRAWRWTTRVGCGPRSSATRTWDEVNLIEQGDNYGWPEVEGPAAARRSSTRWCLAASLASPRGMAFADGAPVDGGACAASACGGSRSAREGVGSRGRSSGGVRAAAHRGRRARRRLWVTTSNRDGRGEPTPDDDRIIRVQP